MSHNMGNNNAKSSEVSIPETTVPSRKTGTSSRNGHYHVRSNTKHVPERYGSQNFRGPKSSSNGDLDQVSSIVNYLSLNGYRMGRVLGEGSYSKVKLCTRYCIDGTPAVRLACKMIDKQKASDDFVTKFLPRELDIINKIEHPNIVKVFNIVEFDQHVYIFMDCCDKGDLLEYVKNRGQISENRGRHYFRQLLSAVRYLHSKDIAHRDLKCENVLLGSGDLIKISDFGFSRYCRDDQGRRILSKTYCGSAAYAAPEILQGTNYNPKLYDMWSLGCILFIMLTGHMPYDESNIPKMLQHQLDRLLTYPGNVEQELSEPAKNLIRRLLEPDVTRRANIDHAVCHEWTNFPTRAPMSHDCYQSGDIEPRNIQSDKSTPAVPMSYYGLPSRSEIFSQLINGAPTNHFPRYQPNTSGSGGKPNMTQQYRTLEASTNSRVRHPGSANRERQCQTQRSGTASTNSVQSNNTQKHRVPATARHQAGPTVSQRSGTTRSSLISGVTQLMNSLSLGGPKGAPTANNSSNQGGGRDNIKKH